MKERSLKTDVPMQRKRSAIASLHNSSFHHRSTSSDSSINPGRCWNSMHNSSEEQLPDHVILSRSPSMEYMSTANRKGHDSSGCSSAESSLNGADDYTNENDPMNVCTVTGLVSGDMQYESSNNLSLNNLTGKHTEQPVGRHLSMQSPFVPQAQSANLEFTRSNENDDDDCQIIERPSVFGTDTSTEQLHGTNRSFQHFVTASGAGGYIVDDTDVKPGSSIDGRKSPWKGKTLEASAGQSSGSGSSNFVPDVDCDWWHAMRFPCNTASGIPSPVENNLSVSFSEQSHPGLGFNIGGTAPAVPLAITASGIMESSRRNFRLRISASHQQDYIPGIASSTENVGRSSNVFSANHSLRLAPISNSLDLGSFTVADDGSLQAPTTTLVRNSQSQWYRASSSGSGNLNTAISEERFAMQDEEPIFRSVSREMSEYPIFIPVTEIGTSSQRSTDWSLAARNMGVSGAVSSSSRSSSGAVVNSTRSSLIAHRTSPQYPRRLSEFVRRSLISLPGTEQNSSYNPPYSSPSSSSPEQIHFSGSGHHRSHTRSAVRLSRHLDRSLGVPYPSRSLVAGSEGRTRLVSEIRSVLNLMRRGEGLGVDDVMILDRSVFYEMADLHDRHRNMRLDVDNMSYEELLALEERIGDVSTGLSEEIISSNLQHRRYKSLNAKDEVEEEPCCICREEYIDGEDLGILVCGHDFHSNCIMQWLMQKNLCPICKTTGLNN